MTPGMMAVAFVSAVDVVTIRAYNIAVAAIDPAAFTGSVLVVRSA